MRPGNLRSILLTLSVERADPDGIVIPAETRASVTRDASRALSRESGRSEQDRFFADRSHRLLDWLASHQRDSAPSLQPPHRLRQAAPVLFIAAAALGWFSQALGAEKSVNILSFPLIGILVWNAAVYLVELISGATGWHRRSDPVSSESTDPAEPGWLDRLAGWLEFSPPRTDAATALPAPLSLGLADFRRRWTALRAPVIRARLRASLHLAAAILAASALAGMYAKGIANEYRAYWESTFLSPDSLRRILGFVLGPASAVSGIPIPDADSLAQLRRSGGSTDAAGENAARWIHLHAVTMSLFVIVPRLLLAAWQIVAARRRERSVDPRTLPSVGLYFERLLAEALGTALPVRAVAYCHRPSPTGEAALRRHIEHELGVPARLDWLPPVSLGGEEAFLADLPGLAAGLPAHLILVVDLAATPEDETHGEWIRQIRDQLARHAPDTRLHLRLDAEAYDLARRQLPDFADRRAGRIAAWRELAGPLDDTVAAFPER